MPGTEIACAICRRPLEVLVEPGRVGYRHYLNDAIQDKTHVPTPIMASESDVVHVCDFCGEPGPVWDYDCAPFITDFDNKDVYESPDGWACCALCARLIEADDYDLLAQRVTLIFLTRHGFMSTGLRDRMAAIQQDFRRFRGERKAM